VYLFSTRIWSSLIKQARKSWIGRWTTQYVICASLGLWTNSLCW
jgi:hypothetical protein